MKRVVKVVQPRFGGLDFLGNVVDERPHAMRLTARLHDASVADRQALLQRVVERISVHNNHLEI